MISLSSLFAPETYATLLTKWLALAEAAGLPVSSWRAGDPTRTSGEYLAEILAQLESVLQEHIAGGFLSLATGDWLTLHAEQVYGVTRVESTYATSASGAGIVLENTGGGLYVIAAGELTFKASSTGKTYRNTSGGTLDSGPSTTLEIDFIADESGSDSSVAIDEIDTMVTSLLGVIVQSAGAATGLDQESDASVRNRCLASLGALSPNGAADAYRYVALNSELTGVTDITKAQVTSNSTLGEVSVYLAGPDGAVAGASVTAAASAIAEWATPLGITVSVQNAIEVPVDVDVTVYISESAGVDEPAAEAAVEASITLTINETPIGGTEGFLFASTVLAACFSALDAGIVYNAIVTMPASDTALATGEVATVGTLTVTVVIV